MGQEKVEIVRRCLEAWQRGDLSAWLATLDPTIEWHTVLERLVEGDTSCYRGHEGMRKLWHAYRTELQSFRLDAQELRDVGDERVLLLGHFWWRGVASGIESGSSLGMVITVRGGKIVRSIDHLTHQDALQAAELANG